MRGEIMDRPLLVSGIVTHAERYFADAEVVSRRVEGGIHRYTYRDAAARMRRLANALEALGVGPATGWRRSRGTPTATTSSTSRSPGQARSATP